MNAGVSYLPALVRPHGHIPVGAASETGVYARAEGCLALFAVAAAPVGDVEGEDDAVAFFEQRYATADFFDDAHVLVACFSCSAYGMPTLFFRTGGIWVCGCEGEGVRTEDEPALGRRSPLVHVQV